MPRTPPPYLAESKPARCTLPQITGAAAVFGFLSDILEADREHVIVFDLNIRNRVIARRTVAIGSVCGVEVSPREIFKGAITASAAAIILAHNHPSGDTAPSRADIELTQRIREGGDLLGIPLLDHVIVGVAGFTSLREMNWGRK